MPIEIRELQIRAVIDTAGPKSSSGTMAGTPPESAVAGNQSPNGLIDLCVEKVLEVLREKEER